MTLIKTSNVKNKSIRLMNPTIKSQIELVNRIVFKHNIIIINVTTIRHL